MKVTLIEGPLAATVKKQAYLTIQKLALAAYEQHLKEEAERKKPASMVGG